MLSPKVEVGDNQVGNGQALDCVKVEDAEVGGQ